VIPELGTILSVWAHPDDEVYSCGAIMAEAVRRGDRVVCVTATRGELGTDDEALKGAPLAAIRTQELADCLAILGVTEHYWLDYPDGGCGEVDREEAVSRIQAFIDDVRPDTILTFGPDGATGHIDHISVCEWTTEALRRSDATATLYYAANSREWTDKYREVLDRFDVFMGNEPVLHSSDELAIEIYAEGELLDQKMAAIRAQASQTAELLDALDPALEREMMAGEWFRTAD
jgi:LmbE family N-acetylglucosaminyl deacetylase